MMTTQDVKARLLVVEDDTHIQLLLGYLLRPWFDLEWAETVEEALTVATHHVFDLFLIDINLGAGPTGFDLLSALREMPHYQTTPAVACTALVLRGDRELYLARGFDGYIRKPFDPRQLQEILKSMVSQRAAA